MFSHLLPLNAWLQGYMDIATFSDLTTTTGGTLYQYTPFNPALDHDQVWGGVWACGKLRQVGWKGRVESRR